ncbi:MAG: hypothetical protein Q8905_14745, partial [Bacteroidota bacterium]|nr:hypothetical protein [Bacteroidota bacterium]
FKSIIGYSWAIISFLIILMLFPSLGPLSKGLTHLPFMKVNAKYSGGEKAYSMAKTGYTLTVNKPVFEALIGSSKKGFVQVRWDGKFQLPHVDTIAIRQNQPADFIIKFNNDTDAPEITSLNPKVKGIGSFAKTEKGWIVRVNMENTYH